jgi:hypothetical protein
LKASDSFGASEHTARAHHAAAHTQTFVHGHNENSATVDGLLAMRQQIESPNLRQWLEQFNG